MFLYSDEYQLFVFTRFADIWATASLIPMPSLFSVFITSFYAIHMKQTILNCLVTSFVPKARQKDKRPKELLLAGR